MWFLTPASPTTVLSRAKTCSVGVTDCDWGVWGVGGVKKDTGHRDSMVFGKGELWRVRALDCHHV